VISDANPYKPPHSNLEASGRSRALADAGRGHACETSLSILEFEYKISAMRWIFNILVFGLGAFLFGAAMYFELTSTHAPRAAHTSSLIRVPFFGLFALISACVAIYSAVRLVRGLGKAPLIVRVGEREVLVPHPSRRGEMLAIPYRIIRRTVETRVRSRHSHQFMIISSLGPATLMAIGFRSEKDFTSFKLTLHARIGVKK